MRVGKASRPYSSSDNQRSGGKHNRLTEVGILCRLSGMPRTGRPPMTDEQIAERIADYQARYQVKELNDAGFPVFPAGLRETAQHREWINLYQLFNRSRRRSGKPGGANDKTTSPSQPCPICLQAVRPPGGTHQRCAVVVGLVRDLGPESLDRIRAAAFSDDAAAPGHSPARKRKL